MSDSSHSERAVCRVQINSTITANISVVDQEERNTFQFELILEKNELLLLTWKLDLVSKIQG